MKKLVWFSFAILFSVGSTSAHSQAICPASVVQSGDGIGDGCSTSYKGVQLAYIPAIGVFRPTFTPACNKHDKCYTTLGTSGHECNSNFLSDMQSACRSDFNPILHPVEYQACNQTALAYRAAVDAYLSYEEPLAEHQSNALAVSRQLELSVKADACATTPERTTLYSPALIAQIKNTFSSYTGRAPTIYEFLEIMNYGNYVYDPASWSNNLINYSVQKVTTPKPPVVGNYLNGRSLTVTPVLSDVTYLWKLDNLGTKEGPAMFVGAAAADLPKYDLDRPLRGFVKATYNKGTAIEISDVSIVETTIFIRGWCSSGPTQQCR